MANGFSQAVVRRSDRIWTSLSLFVIRRYRERFDEYFLEVTGKPLPDDPLFRFKFHATKTGWEYTILEEKTNFAFLLPNFFGVAVRV
jgi:hypothetical protein